jgi:HK97 family phage portal protein
LTRGNVYILKARDARGVVAQLFILDPSRVQPMVADDGSVFYALQADNLSSLMGPVMVPAREIIHDRFNTLFHPLVGTSPIFASGLAATQGLNIQSNSTRFFGNKSMPGGVLTAPGAISDETAARLKVAWDTNYAGENFGKVAVLGDGLKFEPIMMTSTEAQLIEQLQWNAQVVCSAFHVPPYKIGVGDMPTYNNVQALNVEYYSQCLQSLIEAAELCMDEGLEMAQGVGTEFDLEGLLRMDAPTLYKTIADGVKGGFLAPNEGRRKIDLAPTAGGDTPYLQEQNYSLAALAKRDAQADPFNKTAAIAPPSNDDGEEPPEEGEEDGDAERALVVEIAARISDEALRIAS